MNRTVILLVALLSSIGCGNKAEQTDPATNKIDSVTMSRPADEPTGPVTMKDFSTQSGLRMYPGSESAAGDGFKRSDGVIKDIITFSTSDSLDKIAEFYKGEGMDIKTKTMPIGATKSGAQVMVMVSSGKDGNNVVKITGLIEGQKPK